jgi:mRNA-degrading endonuclease RelE of RelBE toxin-antitoxin system
MTWIVTLTRKANKQLVRLPQTIRDIADEAIADMETEGINPERWNTLKTGDDEYRLRLNYRYRMRYRLTRPGMLEIEVFYIGHRSEAYR